MYCIGLDIGGTKCAVTLGKIEGERIEIVKKEQFATAGNTYTQVLEKFCDVIDKVAEGVSFESIGISCGGPLDSKTGVVLCPPNLPDWKNVAVCEYFYNKYNVPVKLQNDANACALAEWKFGAGRGTENMVFITFGTGFGAGLILNGKIYCGANDNAGEVGHVRLTKTGPWGFYKYGSAEGYCSGGGIRQLALIEIEKQLKKGKTPFILQKLGNTDVINAKEIAICAREGDEFCKSIYAKSGKYLGKILSIIIDIINPEKIIIGGVFMRSNDLLLPTAMKEIEKEALSYSASVVEILPAGLGESIGDFAALAVAVNN
jgi:glucokinase